MFNPRFDVVSEFPDKPSITVGGITSSTVTIGVSATLGDSKVSSLDVIYSVAGHTKTQTFTSLGDHVISGLLPYSDYDVEVELVTDLTPDGEKSSTKTFKTRGGKTSRC